MTIGDDADATATARSFALDEFMPSTGGRRVVDDRYELSYPVGRGATATVYLARDLRTRQKVAVKLFDRVSASDRCRFTREVEILRGLDHPGLLGLHGSGTDDGLPYLVLPLINGPTLAARLRDGALPAHETRKLGAELADALAFLHAQDIVHRDLKPANVLLAPDRPMISDFGIARQPDFTMLTGTGELIGTPAYMAPEQVRGETVGAAADVYSLGLVLLECLTGRCEYPGPPAESAVARLHRAPVLPADIDPEVSALLSRMTTAPCPADRPTAREVAEVLSRRRPLSPPGPQHHHTRQRAAARVLATAGFFTAAAAVTAGLILGSRTAVDPDTSPPAGAGTETVVPPPATPLSPGEVTETVVAGNHDETAAAARHPVATTSSPFVRQPEDATSSALPVPAADGATASDKSKKDHRSKAENPAKTTKLDH